VAEVHQRARGPPARRGGFRLDGYAATFELAETEVTPEHWSRR
jgi:hypothetical protein